ncbi:hypothetical protein ABT369_21885 [Dactylosporangium sp. NPDC000244]|uniref:hypothetical protein n=1 Tax=Dactylosporangium sp. NPDC000244 TaxID=3154365 RepID=UPI00332D254A
MDLDELRDELLRHTPDPEAVQNRMTTKRHARRRRRFLLAGTAVCVAVAVGVAAVAWSVDQDPADDTRAAPAASDAGRTGATAVPNPTATTSDTVYAASACVSLTLPALIHQVRTAGASLILAHGTLTGRRGDDPTGPAGLAEMTIDHVETLAGPVVAEHATGWVPTDVGPSGIPIPSNATGSLWAPDGALIGVYWPTLPHASKLGPYLRIAPVVDQQVILTSAGCWLIDGVETRPFTGPLAEVPGSNSFARSAQYGFRALPLDAVRQAAATR